MTRRAWGLGLCWAGILVCLVMAGCEPHGCLLRRQAGRAAPPSPLDELTATSAPEPGSAEDLRVDVARQTRGFFRNDRRAGAWSSEAQQIEADLGVSP